MLAQKIYAIKEKMKICHQILNIYSATVKHSETYLLDSEHTEGKNYDKCMTGLSAIAKMLPSHGRSQKGFSYTEEEFIVFKNTNQLVEDFIKKQSPFNHTLSLKDRIWQLQLSTTQ